MEDLVLWKPLYYTSIAMFIISIILLPFNFQWSVITVFALITLWSRVPGFIHFIFNRLALNDFFTFVVGVHAGGLVGGLFGVYSILFTRVFGPNEWWPYTIRASISGFIAGMAVPLITGIYGYTIVSFLIFEGMLYVIYYALVAMFWKEEMGLEIAILPAVVFFDFITNYFLLKVFGDNLSKLMMQGFSSAWPFLIFAAVIVFFLVVAKNGKKISSFIESIWNFGKKTSGEKKRKSIVEEIG